MSALLQSNLDDVAALRAHLWEAGFRPVGLKTGDKMPLIREWQARARRSPPADAVDPPRSGHLNTGILCDGLRVVDIDTDDPEAARQVQALALAMLGDTAIRTRSNSPRAAMLYRAAEGEPVKCVVSGALGKLEVLGRGQQLHVFGHHPSGADLIWHPAPPGDIHRDGLPVVTNAQIDAFLTAASPMIGANSTHAALPRKERTQRNTFGPTGVDAQDVAAALAAIPNDGHADWEHWNNVGMAAFAATGGSTAGFAAWCAWSEQHPAHDDNAAHERWKHYRVSPPTKTGAGKLFGMARAARPGWTKPTTLTSAAPRAPVMSILARSACSAPVLPLEVFGPFWADWIVRAAQGANAPPDYIALPLLAGASSLLGNARWITAWTGWSEPPILWCASVGNPSSGKSSGASPVTRDILGIVEKYLARDYPKALEEWETVASIAKAVLKQWEKDTAAAVKNKKPIPDKPREAMIPPKPIRPRARVGDVTVEKLALILDQLPKGVLHVRDELAAWLLNLSRYANGGTDRPFWLESYVGGPMQVDRVKNPDPVFIPRLSVATFGTIQPDRLGDVLHGADDGLSSRFLWAWPESIPFSRPASAADIEGAAIRLQALAGLSMPDGGDGSPKPFFVRLEDPAALLLSDFASDMQNREATAHGLLKSSLGKARGQALRLAIVLEYLWWCGDGTSSAMPGIGTIRPEPSSISLRATQAATGLMDGYFLPMARRVLGDAAIPEDERNARTLAAWIVETKPERVNVSSVRDGARLPGLRESDPVKAACRFLTEAGWLSEDPGTGGPGRPRGDYIVDPRVWDAPG